MKRSHFLKGLAAGVTAGVAALLAAPAAHAVTTDYAYLDIQPIGGRVETGYTAVEGGGNGSNGPEVSNLALVSLTGDNFTISLDDTNQAGADDGRIDWRDRGNGSSDPLIALGEDFIKNNSGTVRVTLSGLEAGRYNITSYHVDPDFTQSEAIAVDVSIDNGSGFVSTAAVGDASTNNGGVGGLTTGEVQASAAQFTFTANGTDDVVIVFDGNAAGDTEVPLNGLDIVQVDTSAGFDVTVDIGPNGQDVQSGHIEVSGPGNNTNGTDLGLVQVDAGNGILFGVAIDDTDQSGSDVGGIDWRDRGNSPNSANDLVDLGEDFVKNNQGIIRLTLTDLPEGYYDFTSYHVDPSFDQSEAIDIDVMIESGGSFMSTGAQGNADFNIGIGSLDTSDVLGTLASFSFYANGVDPVVIIFDGTNANDTEVPLNGFNLSLRPVPEPATAMLGLFGAGALLARRRRQA